VLQVGNTWIPELVALDAVVPVDDGLAGPRRRLPVPHERRRRPDVGRAVVRGHGSSSTATTSSRVPAAARRRRRGDWMALLGRIARRAGPDDSALLLPVRE
jgi:hypothetical protein